MNRYFFYLMFFGVVIASGIFLSCKTKKHIAQQKPISDTAKCKLTIKSTKELLQLLQKNSFNYQWIYAKADTKLKIDSEETDVDIRIRSKKDSAILITVEAIGLFDVAKILITNDSVKMVVYPKKKYYYGSIDNISKLLNIHADLDLIQSVLFGNSATFYDSDEKIKLVFNKKDCNYILTTTKKRKIKRLLKDKELLIVREPIQIISILPNTYKISQNEFLDIQNRHSLKVNYFNFQNIDSLVFPRTIQTEVTTNNTFNFNVQYSKVEINKPQNLSLKVPSSYDKIEIK